MPKINARLAHPLRIDLKRPQQKSYPPIHGLYLLLRASGLACLGGTAKKPHLHLDGDVHEDWMALNLAERYATLLETWLLRGKPEIIGEPYRSFGIPENYWLWLRFSNWITDEGGHIHGKKDAEQFLQYVPRWYNLGLLELFGLIAVEDGPPDPGKGRRIDRISCTAVGNALLMLLGDKIFDDFRGIGEIDDTATMPEGVLQPVLQPYLPQIKHTLRVPGWTFREGTHVFTAQLDEMRSRIGLPADATLDDLASVVLEALDFDGDHLYEFRYENRFGAEEHVHHPFMDEGPWTTEVKIGEVPLVVGQTMMFIYDFGDWWEILLNLEMVDSAMTLVQPTILDKQGEPPPQYPDYNWE